MKSSSSDWQVWSQRIALVVFICFISLSMTVHYADIVELTHDSIENGYLVSELTNNVEILLDQIGNTFFDTFDLHTPQFFTTAVVWVGCLLSAVYSTPVKTKEKLSF